MYGECLYVLPGSHSKIIKTDDEGYIVSEQRAYTLEMNGESTGFNTSLKEALLNREWDVVIIQQVSHQSSYYETYQPYLNKLSEYVRFCVPKTKIDKNERI